MTTTQSSAAFSFALRQFRKSRFIVHLKRPFMSLNIWYQVNSGPSEFGTKWTRDQVVNSGPNIFGTR